MAETKRYSPKNTKYLVFLINKLIPIWYGFPHFWYRLAFFTHAQFIPCFYKTWYMNIRFFNFWKLEEILIKSHNEHHKMTSFFNSGKISPVHLHTLHNFSCRWKQNVWFFLHIERAIAGSLHTDIQQTWKDSAI